MKAGPDAAESKTEKTGSPCRSSLLERISTITQDKVNKIETRAPITATPKGAAKDNLGRIESYPRRN
ncbi:hypothetical protein PTTG_26101 [Puccinia triticina 1-1 BBBD Race 1]|uniref:Uncharacterized protein n=1 Tax=Puccinia triticina (isolate 1-1 / race 1 (BBBD)) TaxID=630390 RepID=A0A180GY57_PUCT1|nr:hypothetical protein PTTG_26101 [Puccinia triticina 1-1 BBBD Race 1]